MEKASASTDVQKEISDLENSKKQPVKLVDIPVHDEIGALNLIVSFLALAQKRGSFTFDESAKIWDCIKYFQKTA